MAPSQPTAWKSTAQPAVPNPRPRLRPPPHPSDNREESNGPLDRRGKQSPVGSERSHHHPQMDPQKGLLRRQELCLHFTDKETGFTSEPDCSRVQTGNLMLEKGTKGALSWLMSLEKGCFQALRKTPHRRFPQSFSLGRISPLEYLPIFGLTHYSRKKKSCSEAKKPDG